MNQVRALLQSDLVDSTSIAERMGDEAASALWAAHDHIARDLIRQWRGREIDKSDGFLVVFDSATDAVAYARDYHAAIGSLPHPLAARVGVHSGAIAIRTNPPEDVSAGAKSIEIDGIAKPTTARIMSAAAGGQTLISAAAHAELSGGAVATRPFGHWRLKGIGEPVELFEVIDSTCQQVLPTESAKAYRVALQDGQWVPVREVPHRLPAERDSFVGREQTLRDIQERFGAGTRFVSIVGPGGCGKTRLAWRFAWRSLGDYPGGVWFCDLSQARSAHGVAFAVAQALDVPLGDGDPIAQLGHAISGRGECLVILDNFEQVKSDAETTAGHWLDVTTQAHFLATTREVLDINGEGLLNLDPMEIEEGVELFIQRAQASSPGCLDYIESAEEVARLVALLDCLPLAIELAAVRMRVMPVADIRMRLHERFKLLASRTGRPDRHATLRATIDWSWALLTGPERSALAQLSVFEGGFTLESAEAVVRVAKPRAEVWIADLLQSLVDKSLVRRASATRFELLVSIREYASAQLARASNLGLRDPQIASATLQRHWRHFSAFSERQAIADRCADTDNLVAACRRATEASDSSSAVRALRAAWSVLALRGPYREAIHLANAVKRIANLHTDDRATAEWVDGSAHFMLGDTEAGLAAFERGLVYIKNSKNKSLEALLRCARAEVLTKTAQVDSALKEFALAESAANSADEPELDCRILNAIAIADMSCGRIKEAKSRYARALSIAKAVNDIRWQGGLIGNLAMIDYAEGRVDEAIANYRQALAIGETAGDHRWTGNAHCNLGLALHETGKSHAARDHLQTALRIARDIGHRRLECTALCNLGLVEEAIDDLNAARANYEAAAGIADTLGDRRVQAQLKVPLARLMARLGRTSAARHLFAMATAEFEAAGDRLGLALTLCDQAEINFKHGELVDCVSALQRAQGIAVSLDTEPGSDLGRRLRLVRDALAAKHSTSSTDSDAVNPIID